MTTLSPAPRRFSGSCCLLLATLLAFAPTEARADEDSGPEILIEPILRAELGSGVVISAEIADPDGVFEPKLYFRTIGEAKYLSNAMVPTPRENVFQGEIPSTAVTGPLEYYVEAFDKNGNGPSRSALPSRPHRLFVAPPEQPGRNVREVKTGPEIVHVVVQRAPQGRSIPIETLFRGKDGVFNAVVYFRRIGSASFTPLSMAELPLSAVITVATGDDIILGTAGTGRFVAEIPGAFTNGDIEYYLEAMDSQGNGPSYNGSRERPHVIHTFLEKVERVDPEVALMACREVPREGESPDIERLGPCRRSDQTIPLDAIGRFGLGEVKMRYDNFPDAVAAFEEATRISPKWPAPWFRLAQAAESQRDWPKARDAYRAYLELAGRPPEFEALLKRIAQVEYELDLLHRDAQEAASRESEARAKEDQKRSLREAVERERAETAGREMLLSAPGQWAFIGLTSETYAPAGGPAQQAVSLEIRLRLKLRQLPFLYVGLGGALSAAIPGADGSAAQAVFTAVPAIGLNLLALPVPRSSGFTLLSPFAAWQPRFQVTGPLASQGAGGGPLVNTVVVGNHFEFGAWSLEATYGFGLDSHLTQQFGLSLGRRLADGD
jgi:tetratricopeptide (TPR) repeat protein